MSKFFKPGGAGLSSNKEEWETPQELFNELNDKWMFTLDPCATAENAKCKKFFTKEQNGLLKSWEGETVFCNPPYGRKIKEWVKKCSEEKADIVLLIPARTDTSYFHDYILNKAQIFFLRGRLKFEIGGVPNNPAPFPSMIVIFRNK